VALQKTLEGDKSEGGALRINVVERTLRHSVIGGRFVPLKRKLGGGGGGNRIVGGALSTEGGSEGQQRFSRLMPARKWEKDTMRGKRPRQRRKAWGEEGRGETSTCRNR